MSASLIIKVNMRVQTLKQEILNRYQWICRIIICYQEQLEKLPEGKLRIHRNNKSVSYYRVNENENNNGSLITDRHLIQMLGQRQYIKNLLKSAEAEKKELKRLIDRYPEQTVEDIYGTFNRERQSLINPIELPDKEFINNWLSKPYQGKGFGNGDPYYMTLKGERVRSKSEQLIADRLYNKNIPYKYECPLQIGKYTVYPDFTNLRMSDREEVYLENFGRMDDKDYSDGTLWKINYYSLHGLLFGKNFFATFESKDHPLDVRVLDKIIDQQLI